MLDFLDSMLRRLLITRVAGITDVMQVRFQPPDQDWRTYVSNLTVGGLQVNALNVYLVDLRESRGLRSNEWQREYVNGFVEETPAPRRMTCHYLITAWSPANVTPAIEPTLDEHLLLYQVTAALTDAEPLVASEIYAPGPLPPGFPALIADTELPTVVLPAEGFPKYAEFWGTMGATHPWKPAVYLEVTLPVQLRTEIAGPIVTTRITEYRQADGAAIGETWIQIGGTVFNPAAQPVPNAWVRLETVAGMPLQHLTSGTLGRFTFGGLHPGSYRLHVRVAGLGDKTRTVLVPSGSGEYDLSYP